MTALVARRRRAAGPRLNSGSHVLSKSPALSSLIRAFRRRVRPPLSSQVVTWARAHASASVLAGLGREYLRPADALMIERLLRTGRHEKAAQHFCDRFSARCFPLEYVWTGGRGNRLLLEVAAGIQHERYGENWEEIGDLWSLKTVFLLSWALMEDPYGALRDEFMQDEPGGDERGDAYRLCDEARDAVAQFAQLDVHELFADVPRDGFSADHLRARFSGSNWEPLLWAAPWLWRLSGNTFLDEDDGDFGEPEPWSVAAVLKLAAEYRESVRIMRAIHRFDDWLNEAPVERASAAIRAALGPPGDRTSTLTDLPVLPRPDHTSGLEQEMAAEGV